MGYLITYVYKNWSSEILILERPPEQKVKSLEIPQDMGMEREVINFFNDQQLNIQKLACSELKLNFDLLSPFSSFL